MSLIFLIKKVMINKFIYFVFSLGIIVSLGCQNQKKEIKEEKLTFNKNLIGEWRLNSIGVNFSTKNNSHSNTTLTQLYIPIFNNDQLKINENGKLFIGNSFIGKINCLKDSLIITYNNGNMDNIKSPLPLNKKVYFRVKRKFLIELRFQQKGVNNENANFYFTLTKYRNGRLSERKDDEKAAIESIEN